MTDILFSKTPFQTPTTFSSENIELAEPWRRFAASATDALLILIAHLCVLCPAFLLSWIDPRPGWPIEAASSLVSWTWLWWGWANGATTGKKWWGVRLVRSDGSAMDKRAALKRILGYALAILPLRAGLWPILSHPQRQGWHDRFADSLAVRVVPVPIIASFERFVMALLQRKPMSALLGRAAPILKSGNLIPHRTSAKPDRKTPLIHHVWPAPDWSAVRRGLVFALAFYVMLAIVLTWPTIAQLSTRRAGDNGDGWQFVWNYRHFARALQGQTPFLSSTDLFYPFEVPLVFNTTHWFNGALSVPLSRFLNPIAVYNTLYLGTLVMSATSGFVLYAALSRRVAPAVLCGAVFGFSPYFLAHGMGHPNLISAQFLPLFALSWWQLLRTGRARWGAASGLMLAFNAWCDWHWLLFALVLGAVLLACVPHLTRQGWQWWRVRLRAIVAMGMVAGVLLAPLLWTAVREVGRSSYANRSGESGGFRLDLADYFKFSALHPNSVERATTSSNDAKVKVNVENEVSPGLVFWVLAACGLWGLAHRGRRARLLRPWRWVAVCAILLTSGTHLSWYGNRADMGLAVLTLSGAPGNGFDWPWQNRSRLDMCRTFTTYGNFSSEVPVFLPSSWLQGKIPFLKPFRVISRFAVLLLLAVGLAATFGLARVQERLQKHLQVLAPPRRRTRAFLSASGVWLGASAWMMWEFAATPYPNVSSEFDPFYARMGRERERYAVVEAPVFSDSSAMWLQTIHGKPILHGHIARCPPEAFQLTESNAILVALGEHNVADLQKMSPEKLRAARRQLRDLKVRYVLVRQSSVRAALERALGQTGFDLEYRSDQLSVFRI